MLTIENIPTPLGLGIDTDDETAQITTADGQHVATVGINPHVKMAERMAACYNACEGINPEAIADMVAALRALVDVASNQLPERRKRSVWRSGRWKTMRIVRAASIAMSA